MPEILSKSCQVYKEVTEMKQSAEVFSECELKFMFAICHRPSFVCLSLTLVHPTQAIEIFGDVSTPFGTLAIC